MPALRGRTVTMREADFGLPGYDAWRTREPDWVADERSECEQAGCDRDGHVSGCPDYEEEDE